jgi:hypothetical protein
MALVATRGLPQVLLLLGMAHPWLLSSEGYLLTTFIMPGEIAGVSKKPKKKTFGGTLVRPIVRPILR